MPNRQAMLGIFYVLLNGIPWNALPREYSSPRDIAVSEGLVYFVEAKSHKISRLDPITGAISERLIRVAESADLTIGSIAVYGGLVYFTEVLDNQICRLEVF